MSASHVSRRTRRSSAGFSLVELMVTVAIALFLVGGLLTIVQNVRRTYTEQQALAQLQDTQRFAMTVITDVVQSGSYYPPTSPPAWVPSIALPAAGGFIAGQAFLGTQVAGNPDSLTVRYRTAGSDQVLLCNGTSNPNPDPATSAVYTNAFTVDPVALQLNCSVNGGANAMLANGVSNMQIFFGVKRNNAINDYNVDNYLTAAQMNLAGPNGNDWLNISTVRVVLTFVNPLYRAANQGQAQFLTFERVIQVMGRAGVHT